MKKITILALVCALVVTTVGGTAVAKNSGPGSPNSGKKVTTYNFDGIVTAVTSGGTRHRSGDGCDDDNFALRHAGSEERQ